MLRTVEYGPCIQRATSTFQPAPDWMGARRNRNSAAGFVRDKRARRNLHYQQPYMGPPSGGFCLHQLVPELTGNADIKLNARLRLPNMAVVLSSIASRAFPHCPHDARSGVAALRVHRGGGGPA
jgi:hypothetical protein